MVQIAGIYFFLYHCSTDQGWVTLLLGDSFSLYKIGEKNLCGWKHPCKYRDVMSEYMILISLLPLSTYLQLKEMAKDWWSMKAET